MPPNKCLQIFRGIQLLLLLLVLTEKQTKSKPKQDLCAYVNFSNAPQQTAKTAKPYPVPSPDAVADGDGSGAVGGAGTGNETGKHSNRQSVAQSCGAKRKINKYLYR